MKSFEIKDVVNCYSNLLKNMKYHIIHITYFFATILFLSSLIFPTGCSEDKTELSTTKEMPERSIAERRALREKEFQKSVMDPVKTPVEEEGSVETAPVVHGFGEKTDTEIAREKPRAPIIAVLGPLTGELEYYGKETSNGAELASDEIDEQGGINGKKFGLLVYDTKGTIPGTLSGVEAFIDRKVLAVVGAATGEVSFSANKMINDYQLILVSAGSRRRLGDTGPYNFRNTLDDRHGIKSLIDYIKKNKKWKTFALFSSLVNDYSINLTAVFKSELINQNLSISHELYFYSTAMSNIPEEESDIAKQIAKLKKNTPDAMVFTGEGKEARVLVEEMRKQGINIPLIGSEDINIPDFVSLGKQTVGTLIYGGFDENSRNPKVHKFVTDYKARFGSTPSRLAALSYDVVYLISEAIRRAESLRPSHVRKALLSIKDFEGVTGKTSMTSTGESIKEPFIFEMMKSNGKHDFVGVKEPS